MSSRSGSNSHRRHSREPLEEFPPLPAPRLPSLRTLHAEHDRNAPGTILGDRPLSRHRSSIARRTERIRELVPQVTRGWAEIWGQEPREDGRRTASARQQETPRTQNSSTNIVELDRSLEAANAHLRALLQLHNTGSDVPPQPMSFSPPLRPQDPSDDNRRHKRRKLESDRLQQTYKGFRYGKYGQVEPGQLRMEIVSCDGGMFSHSDASYPPENILKNDNSVYCTKGNRCNIVLRHQGGTIFTLQELVIKAPASMNYSHPVREGMVFIAMDEDDAFNRTVQYQIVYSSKNRDDSSPEEREPPRPEIVSVQHHDDGTTTTVSAVAPHRFSHLYRHHPHLIGADLDPNATESRTPLMPPEFTSNLPDLRITTECSDDEDDEAESAARRLSRRVPPNRIGALPFENQESDSDGNPFGSEDNVEDPNNPSTWRLYNPPQLRTNSRRTGAGVAANAGTGTGTGTGTSASTQNRSSITLAEAWEAHASATQDAVRAVGGELQSPHARFYIEKKKSKCTIRFDPPVSGRFMLLKMWSSQHDPSSNIDIQSVTARGYAGPRYFPSVELR